jgi:hypothetical protein
MFVDNIGKVEESNVVGLMTTSSFFSLSMDGNTDIASREQETLYARIVKNGEVVTKYLKIAEPESIRSEDLIQLIMSTIDELDLANTVEKLVGFELLTCLVLGQELSPSSTKSVQVS